jgi:hypothetical protein
VDDADGDEIGAIKPFLGQIKFPSGFVMNKALQDVLPKERLRLKYAWGIRNQYIMTKFETNSNTVKRETLASSLQLR